MSGQCTGWVMRHGPRPGMLDAAGEPYTLGRARALRAVLLTISDAANRDGEYARPTKDGIVEGSLYSRGQATRIVSALIADGWLEVTEQGGGRGLATTYRVLMPQEAARDEPLSPGDNSGNRLILAPKPAHPGPKPAHAAPADLELSANTGYTEPLHTDARELFEELWAAYPRRVGKPTARAAFLRALQRGASPEQIVEGARAAAASWRAARTEERFVPHPATWLNRDGWNDRIAPEAGAGPAPPAPRPVCALCNRHTLQLIECPLDAGDCPVTFGGTLAKLAKSVGNHPAAGAQ